MFLHMSVILFTDGGDCGGGDVCYGGGMHGRGYAWQGDMCTTGGMCATEGMCGGGVRGRGVGVAGGVHGGGSMWWGEAGRAWQKRQPLQRAVRILLECILVIHSISSSFQQNTA